LGVDDDKTILDVQLENKATFLKNISGGRVVGRSNRLTPTVGREEVRWRV